MRLAYPWLLAATIVLVACFFSRPARAQEVRGPAASPVLHVLTLDSEDADDPAAALTVALRARAREKLGWKVADSSPSLAMFLAALRCPSQPDAACLQRIADQLKTDRFMYGHVKRVIKDEVSAEIHFYTRGKPDASVQEVFSDKVKEANDDYLQRMAARIVERLIGASTSTGTISLQAGDGDGDVWVDGTEKTHLKKGRA
ncbi:MAG TPA: hypothetical protein VNO21_10640, partial [Polyangiaceae bacterium]|nr:hypothetical protein [Polyangiaceae bacterium]